MKRNHKFQSNRKSNHTVTLRTVRIAQKSQYYKMSLADAYEIVAGYKEIHAATPEARDFIYRRALNMVRSDDKAFAGEIIADRYKKSQSVQQALSLADAYDIVGGYKAADDRTFKKAVKILKDNKVEEEFVSLLVDMRKHNTSFSEVDPEVYAKNLQTAYNMLNHHDEHEQNVLSRDEVRKALNSTVIQGRDGEIIGEDREQMDHVIVNTAVAETADSIIASSEIVENSSENIDAMIANNTRRIIAIERAQGLNASDEERIDAVKAHKTSFKDRLRKAFNFNEHVNISGEKIIARFNKAKETVQASVEMAAKSVHKGVKIAANKFLKVAAIYLAAATLTASVASCGPNTKTDSKPNAIELNDPIQPQKAGPTLEPKKEAVADTIVVPTEYSADMKLKGGAAKFKMLQEYYGERFDEAYKFFSQRDSLLVSQDGQNTLTVMQAMDQLRGHHDMKPNNKIMQKDMKNATACEDEIHENITKEDVADLFTPIPTGDRDSRTTGLSYPDCNSYKAKHVFNKKKQAPVVEENIPVDTLNTTNPVDSTLIINDGDGKVVINTVIEQKEVASNVVAAQYEKSNVNNKGNINDTQVLGDVSVQKVLNVKVDGKNIKVEKTDAPVSTPKAQDAEDVSVVFMKGNENLFEVLDTASVDDVLDVKVDANKTIKTSGTAASVATDANKPASQSTTSTFTSEGETITFDDESDSTLVSSPVIIEQSDSTLNNSASTFVADNQDDSFEIVIGAENAELGAPSAGYVDARGGYNNTGLNKAELKTDREYFKNKHGEGAYDAYVETLTAHPELFTNGAAFGGWVPEQALHAWRATEKWSDNNIENKFADPKMVSVNIVMENFIDNKCGKDSLTADEQSLMLEVFDKVTTTGRIFGVEGNKAVWNSELRANDDCDTPSTRVIAPTNGAHSGPWGIAMPRIFAPKDLPITVNEGQGEVRINTYVTQTEVASQAISAQYEMSNVDNNGNITDTKVKKQVSVDKVVNGVHVNPKKNIKVQKYQNLAQLRKAKARGIN